jgi:hypothetical protein
MDLYLDSPVCIIQLNLDDVIMDYSDDKLLDKLEEMEKKRRYL